MSVGSAPKTSNYHRRISLIKNSSALADTSLLEPADDEKERSQRRSMVAMQQKLSNISSSPQSLSINFAKTDESQIKETLKSYVEMNAHNRISLKNAWKIHIIDLMDNVKSVEAKTNVLQLVGLSLDVGAKVYGLRVDDVHAKILQLASTVTQKNENEEAENQNMDVDTTVTQGQRRRNVRKKTKKLASDKRNTIDKEEKTLYGPIKHVESMVFATNENIEASPIDNLFTSKLPLNPSNHQLMLLSSDKHWTCDPDKHLVEADHLLDIEIPTVTHYNLCSTFKDFEIGSLDKEEENSLLEKGVTFQDVVLDENGVPVVELDSSVHDIFGDCNESSEEQVNDVEEQNQIFQAQIHGEVVPIVDAIPEEDRVETDYGYNTLVKTSSGKYIDKIWAGPSHWKVKFNKSSSAKFSGAVVAQAVKRTRKNKGPQMIDFLNPGPEFTKTYKELVLKRRPPTSTYDKLTLPVPDLIGHNIDKSFDELLIKPGVQRPRLDISKIKQTECEIDYNYENLDDSQYCSRNNNDDADNAVPVNDFEGEVMQVAQHHFLEENLVDAPELASATYVPYAKRAKNMNMKKLKTTIWRGITWSSEGNNKDVTVVPTKFSQLYQKLPEMVTPEMKEELTCPLALVALLHLCNENNLVLQQNENNDFTILSVEEKNSH